MWIWVTVAVAAVIAIGAIAGIVFVFNKDLTSTGPRATTGGGGGAFGALAEVFDPGAHRAQLELEKLKNQAAVIPNPTGDDPRRSSVVTDRHGNPVGFRVGQPAPTETAE